MESGREDGEEEERQQGRARGGLERGDRQGDMIVSRGKQLCGKHLAHAHEFIVAHVLIVHFEPQTHLLPLFRVHIELHRLLPHRVESATSHLTETQVSSDSESSEWWQ